MTAATRGAVTALLDDLRKQFGPEVLYDLFARLQPIVTAGEYPRLVVAPAFEGNPESLLCPHCRTTVADANGGYTALDVVDVAWRTTTADEADFETHEVTVWYDQGGEYDGLVYQCGECAEPVRLPEGWREV